MKFFSSLMPKNYSSHFDLKALLNAFPQKLMVSIISMNVNKVELPVTKGFTIVHCRLWKMVHGSNLNWNRCIKCQYWVLLTHELPPFWQACTQTLFYFSFRSFRKHRHARERGEHASAEREEEKYIFSFPHPYPFALAVNKAPAVFIFYHARSTDFEEKIEGLWTGYFLAGKQDSRRHSTTSFSDNVVVAGTSYQMWEVSSFYHRERA